MASSGCCKIIWKSLSPYFPAFSYKIKNTWITKKGGHTVTCKALLYIASNDRFFDDSKGAEICAVMMWIGISILDGFITE